MTSRRTRTEDGPAVAYGETDRTVVVKMDKHFSVVERWTLPRAVLDRMRPMSNSGGSWGPDGLLYITGHDLPELYVLTLPETGSELHWVATIRAPGLEGQGIAWDRSVRERVLWGIRRSDREILQFHIPKIPRNLARGRPAALGKVVSDCWPRVLFLSIRKMVPLTSINQHPELRKIASAGLGAAFLYLGSEAHIRPAQSLLIHRMPAEARRKSMTIRAAADRPGTGVAEPGPPPLGPPTPTESPGRR